MFPSLLPRSCITFWYSTLVKPRPPYSFADLHPEGAHAAQLGEDGLRVLARCVDLDRVHLVAQELAHPVVEARELRAVLGGQGIGMDEVEAEAAQEQLAQEARLGPFGLARGFGDLARFALADGGGTAHCKGILRGSPSGADRTGSRSVPSVSVIAQTRRRPAWYSSKGILQAGAVLAAHIENREANTWQPSLPVPTLAYAREARRLPRAPSRPARARSSSSRWEARGTAFPTADVRELVRAVAITPLPNAPAVIEGVVNVRGRVLPVLDVRARFRLPAKPLDPSDHFIVASAGPRGVILRVDRATHLALVDEASVQAAGDARTERDLRGRGGQARRRPGAHPRPGDVPLRRGGRLPRRGARARRPRDEGASSSPWWRSGRAWCSRPTGAWRRRPASRAP